MPGSERKRELRRRRHRRVKVAKIAARAEKASGSEKKVLADKLRGLTPGCNIIIEKLGLDK